MGFDASYADMYIDTKHTTQTQSYLIYGEELFKFFFSRYGGHAIKRFYIRKSSSMYTQVEVHLQKLKVYFLNCSMMYKGSHDQNMYKGWWTQISQNASLLDLKKRLVDHLRSAGLNVGVDELRLWNYASDNGKGDLKTEVDKIS